MPVKRNINQNWNNQIGDNMFGFSSNNQEITSPNLDVTPQQQQYFSGTNPGAYGSGDWRDNMNQLHNWGDSGARYEYNRPYNMRDVAGEVGEYGQKPGQGIMASDQAQKQKKSIFDFMPGKVLLSNFAEKFKRPEQMNEAYESITDSIDPNTGRGTYKGNEYRIEGNKIYSELFPQGKNFDSMSGSKSIEEMENEGYGSLGWAQDRVDKGKKISKRLRDILIRRGMADTPGNVTQDAPPTVDLSTIVDKVGPVNTGNTGDGGGQRDTSGWSSPGYSTRGGFAPRSTSARQHSGAGTTSDVRGHHSWADGGRVGYQDGELVEQQTDFIQGPQGGEEFQETVVEGEEQPSREQLEALAMHIFQLPLEELDEQQLVVVYQAAMQEQPMEEAVQEEDVQFAAQGGLAGLL